MARRASRRRTSKRPLRRNASLVAYHASSTNMKKPTVFKPFRNMDFGPGFYMATNCDDAMVYGTYVHQAVVRLDRPIWLKRGSSDPELVAWFQRVLKITDEDLAFYKHPLVGVFELAKTLVDVGSLKPASLVAALQKKGYDGIRVESAVIAEHFTEMPKTRGDYIAIWSPDQLLSWDSARCP